MFSDWSCKMDLVAQRWRPVQYSQVDEELSLATDGTSKNSNNLCFIGAGGNKGVSSICRGDRRNVCVVGIGGS